MSQQVTVTKEKVMSGPGQNVRTTTYESKVSYDSDSKGGSRRGPSTKSRQVFINRSAPPAYGAGSSVVSRSYSSSSSAGMAPGGFQLVSQTGVTNVKDSRVQEKKDMQDLNERFASYIEKVRFLEAQNRKLADELEKLKARWGKETQAIKNMYEQEMADLRDSENTSNIEKQSLQVDLEAQLEIQEELKQKIRDLEDEVERLKEKNDVQVRELSDKTSELNLMRNTCEMMNGERDNNRKEIKRLQDLVNKLRCDLDRETLCHIESENKAMTLKDELDFLKEVHEEELKELAALAYRDTTQENREFWKNEMGNALREISGTYDDKLQQMRSEMETYYNIKVQEFRTGSARNDMETTHAREESKRLKTLLEDNRHKLSDAMARIGDLERQLEAATRDAAEKEREWEQECNSLKQEVAKLRAEMEAILKELQDLMDTKLGLELEIAAYRKLLEGEESRFAYNVLSGLTQLTSALDPPYKRSDNNDTKPSLANESAVEHISTEELEIFPSAPTPEEPLEEPQSLPDPTSPTGLQAEPNPVSEAETEPDQEAFESDVDASKAIVVESAIEPLDENQKETLEEMESPQTEHDTEADSTNKLSEEPDKSEPKGTGGENGTKTLMADVILPETTEKDHAQPALIAAKKLPNPLHESQNLSKSAELDNEEKDDDTSTKIKVLAKEKPVEKSEVTVDRDIQKPAEEIKDTPVGTVEQKTPIDNEETGAETDQTSPVEVIEATKNIMEESKASAEETVGEAEEKYAPDEKEVVEYTKSEPDETDEEESTAQVSLDESREKHANNQFDDRMENNIDTTLAKPENNTGKIVDSKTITHIQNNDEKIDESKPSPTDSHNQTPKNSPSLEPIHKHTSPIHPEQSQIIQSKVEKEDDQSVNHTDSSLKVSQVVKGEMSAKTTYQRSAKGPISVSECTGDGRCITLENTGRREENLGSWQIVRTVDGVNKDAIILDKRVTLRAGGKIKIWSSDAKPSEVQSNDIKTSCPNFGMGSNIITKLINENNEEKATHVQKTMYSS